MILRHPHPLRKKKEKENKEYKEEVDNGAN